MGHVLGHVMSWFSTENPVTSINSLTFSILAVVTYLLILSIIAFCGQFSFGDCEFTAPVVYLKS